MNKPVEAMTDDELDHELLQQNEWSADDAFEYTASGRGDNGFSRDNYIAKLYAEAVRRGLREPLPEDDPDFEEIRSYMFSKDYVWHRGEFVKGETVCEFSAAAAEWHAQYAESARQINHQEMWG